MLSYKSMFKKKKIHIPTLYLTIFSVSLLIIILTLIKTEKNLLTKKIRSNTYVNNILIEKLSPEEAIVVLKEKLKPPTSLTVIVSAKPNENETVILDPNLVNFDYDWETTMNKILSQQGKLSFTTDFLSLSKNPKNFTIETKYNQEKLTQTLQNLLSPLQIDPIYPEAKMDNNQIIIEPGKKGYLLNQNETQKQIIEALAKGETALTIKFDEVNPTISNVEADLFKIRAEKFIGKKIILQRSQDSSIEITQNELLSFLNPVDFNKEKIVEKLNLIKSQTDKEARNPIFTFENGKVKEFEPSTEGISLNIEQTYQNLLNQLIQIENNPSTTELLVQMSVNVTQPSIQTHEVNDLGIKEIIGVGTSKFKGSIPSRVHNVALAASIINGTLIKPGETFSFNKALGDVSKLTGYKEAYIIQDGKTILGDGGGVCQVSTTLFRAALKAGLPITERRGHSYRVGYYEQDSPAGLDATVFSPTTDFKFTNDTPGHILIQTKTDTKNMILTFELYGTADGRISTVSKPQIYDFVSPPEDLYIDDPTLKVGVVKQIEHKAVGSKSRFTYEVKRGDEVIYSKTFISNYRPWGAVYLRGTML